MNTELENYLREVVRKNAGASDALISNAQENAGFVFPKDYVEVIKEFNGGEGEVGERGWLNLFPVDDLNATNKDYDLLMNDIPDYFLFGKDAADTGYAFHKTKHTYHSFGLL
jgi:hypothetical protein